ncbi:MAG: hypothetical protein B7Z55_07505 [Planctomycetales bacterium 12-60-4]|nr:MAG: hypothetical protein B7Z55_07505 [Planctomycetales bacterium 12-60-4]
MTSTTIDHTGRRLGLSRRRFHWNTWASTWVAVITCLATGCGTPASPLDEPMGYKSTSELKARLLEVSKYGDGGSSLGGIPESIEQLTQTEPDKGKKLLADFNRLNTAESKDARKKIAKEMADQLD